jgi:hypothetical protein
MGTGEFLAGICLVFQKDTPYPAASGGIGFRAVAGATPAAFAVRKTSFPLANGFG